MFRYALALSTLVVYVSGHGRLSQPPSRASAWRAGFPTRPDYDDDGRNCGGFYHQHYVTGGICGICGNPYDQPQPRDHELGGIYGDGIIVANYISGQVFQATIIITAYHKGYWELKICTDPYNNEQECFEDYIVELEEGGTKYYPPKDGAYNVNYRLPAGLVCDHCVLQWKYTAGNNWGDCRNGTQGLGCGDQEQFYACADISIGIPAAFAEDDYSQSYYQRLGFLDLQELLKLLRQVNPRPRLNVGPRRPDKRPRIHKDHKRRRKKPKTKKGKKNN